MKVEVTCKIRTIRTHRVSKKMMTALCDLTLSGGTMWRSFLNARDNKVGTVYVATIKGVPVGWLLHRPNPPWEQEGTDDVKIFVHRNLRRQGVGAALMKIAKRNSGPRMVVYPWNETSDEFFDKTSPAKAIFCKDWSQRGIDITRL